MLAPRDCYRGSNWDAVAPATPHFEKIVLSVFYEGWKAYLYQSTETASDKRVDMWAKTAVDKAVTEEISASLNDINTQTQIMNDVIVQKFNQLNKPFQNQSKKQNAEIKAL